jgi:hypothetical protein
MPPVYITNEVITLTTETPCPEEESAAELREEIVERLRHLTAEQLHSFIAEVDALLSQESQ